MSDGGGRRVPPSTAIAALQLAMSVPLFWNSEGLPIGAHFVGRFGDEATLFRLASQLEKGMTLGHKERKKDKNTKIHFMFLVSEFARVLRQPSRLS